MTSAAPGANADDGGWVGVFVRRPILALVLNLLIIIAGIAAYQGIEVRELPDVDRPVVTVRATYAGATPESIDSQITAVIESAVSRVQGVTSISSNSSYGSARISIEFSSRTNLDNAAMDVRDAVAGIVNQLPKDMEDEPRVVKADADATPDHADVGVGCEDVRGRADRPRQQRHRGQAGGGRRRRRGKFLRPARQDHRSARQSDGARRRAASVSPI